MKKIPSIALLQISRNDLGLRPENVHALKLASLSTDQNEILCIDDLPSLTPFPSNRFALVDHNRLLSQFAENNSDVKVVVVLDHHEDEGLYKDTADPRMIVVPTGSASSVVTQYIRREVLDGVEGVSIPRELSDLLLTAILVDTNGLVPGGKGELLDHEAAAFLVPRSSILGSKSEVSNPGSTPGAVSFLSTGSSETELHKLPPLRSLAEELSEKKNNISDLTSLDLLRRDYKQYAWTPSSSWTSSSTQPIQVGLSTVPLDLRDWFLRDLTSTPSSDSELVFWNSIDSFINQRGLDVLGILTTFRKHGKHRRQALFVINSTSEQEKISGLEKRIQEGLEGSEQLALKQKEISDMISKYLSKHLKKEKGKREEIAKQIKDGKENVKHKIHLYKQGNAKATRKVVAPLLKQIVEGP